MVQSDANKLPLYCAKYSSWLNLEAILFIKLLQKFSRLQHFEFIKRHSGFQILD